MLLTNVKAPEPLVLSVIILIQAVQYQKYDYTQETGHSCLLVTCDILTGKSVFVVLYLSDNNNSKYLQIHDDHKSKKYHILLI